MIFGQNGALLDDLEDEQLARELKDRRREHAWWPALIFCFVSAGFSAACVDDHQIDAEPWLLGCFAVLVATTIWSALATFGVRAVDEGSLPVNWQTPPLYRHISGLIGAIGISVALALVWGARQLERAYGHIKITDDIGIWVISSFALVFVILITLPKLGSSTFVKKMTNWINLSNWSGTLVGRATTSVSIAFSKVDSWLVYIVAPVAGATQKLWYERYLVSSLYLLPSAVLAWVLPAPWGFVPIAWAFLICVSIGRRWAWIEIDRQIVLRRPDTDPTSLRIGTDQDLRDEALLALLFFILLLPFGMRQAHMGFGADAFLVSQQDLNNPLAWLSFFGVELAKAVPFVDWFDIYGAESSSAIAYTTALGSHIVFAMRAVVDLVFLSAIVQAVTISVRIIEHRRSFFSGEINRLDPMLENSEFEGLMEVAPNGDHEVSERAEQYKHYDVKRLAYLKVASTPGSPLQLVATRLRELSGLAATAGEAFLEACADPKGTPKKVLTSYENARDSRDLPFAFVVAARVYLNRRPEFNDIRGRLVRLIVEADPGHEKTAALRNILVGKNADSILRNRKMVIDKIGIAATYDPISLRTLRLARTSDPSKEVRLDLDRVLSNLEKNQQVARPNLRAAA